jgi:hypothetical protein
MKKYRKPQQQEHTYSRKGALDKTAYAIGRRLTDAEEKTLAAQWPQAVTEKLIDAAVQELGDAVPTEAEALSVINSIEMVGDQAVSLRRQMRQYDRDANGEFDVC